MTEEEWMTCQNPQTMLDHLLDVRNHDIMGGSAICQAENRRQLPDERLAILAGMLQSICNWEQHVFAKVTSHLTITHWKTGNGHVSSSFQIQHKSPVQGEAVAWEIHVRNTAAESAIRDISDYRVGDPWLIIRDGHLYQYAPCHIASASGMNLHTGRSWYRIVNWLTPTVRLLILAASKEMTFFAEECPRCITMSIGKIIQCSECDNRGYVRTHESYNSDRLHVLGDAMEEAGCPIEETHDGDVIVNPVLAHLRLPCLHHHHCWVMDILLNEDIR